MIALDSNLFIYLLEAHPQFGLLAKSIFLAAEQGQLTVCASQLTFLEVLAYPELSSQQANLKQQQLAKLGVDFSPVELPVLLLAAQLRRQHKLGALDSIHVASALTAGCTHFVTNDQTLLKRQVPGVKLTPLRSAPKLLNLDIANPSTD